MRENQLEQSPWFDIQQQTAATNTKNIRMLMQNPTRNFSGGMRNLGHTIQNNNNMGDRDISNTIAEDEIREATSHATLGKCPKSLYDLWNEWEHGIGGRKAAKKFNATERGMRYVKHNYSKRKPYWLLVNSMCNRGHTAKAAISLIYEVYGESQPVSYILKRIRKDKGKNPLFHATVN